MIAWLFPGQGSQRPGMASDLSACEELFERARAVIGTDLRKAALGRSIAEWPPEIIQPAIFITSVGASVAIERRGLRPSAVAGHSLGEYAALVAAGSLTFEDAISVVAERGKAMAAAGRKNPGGMAAVIGAEASRIEEICSSLDGVWVANYNTPSQTVISGRDASLASAAERCLAAGATKVVRLAVPTAAHTPLMSEAADAVRVSLTNVSVSPPTSAFYSPVDAKLHREDEIADLLVRGITSPVRFGMTLRSMFDGGIDSFVEVGPGRVLQGLVKQNLPDALVAGVGADGEVEALAFGMTRASR